jgi:hypothetical protein
MKGVLFCMLAAGAAAQIYQMPPPTTAPDDTISDCTNWVVANASSDCSEIASYYAITEGQFEDDYVSFVL